MTDTATITYHDDEEKKQIDQIANQLTAATNSYVAPNDVTPATNQHPIPQIVQAQSPTGVNDSQPSENKSEPEIIDTIKGLQGKPRTARSEQFLGPAMKRVSKMNQGAPVKLEEGKKN